MPYVPRFRNDVFLSYSHHDDPLWIEAFERALRLELVERLGREVALWQDVRLLRAAQDWKDEIEEGIRGAATFLAVISPGYRASEWCGRERDCFRNQFALLDEMKVPTKVGNLFRFLKAVKLPWEDDGHLLFFEQAQHVEFFTRDEQGVADEIPPGTAMFQTKLRKIAHSIVCLLTAMRRSMQSVFVATPAADVLDESESLRRELEAQGYAVRPDGPLDELFSEQAIRKEIAPALVSVHLLGESYSPFAERQLRMAQELEKRLICRIPRTADARQSALVESLSRGNPAPVTLLSGPAHRVTTELLQLLAASPASNGSLRNAGPSSLYLVCDRSAPEDYDHAEALRTAIAKEEDIQVYLPAVGANGPRELVETHLSRLRECDGVLLFRNKAPLEWLRENVQQVLFAEQIVKRSPMKAKAYLLDQPELLPGVQNVIPWAPNLGLARLEPFLAALRGRGGTDARP